MIEVFNYQRKVKIDTDELRRFVAAAAPVVKETGGKDFIVAFVSNRKMRELNKNFRGKNSTTDVLSFPSEPQNSEADDILDDEYLFDEEENNLGGIAICAAQAAKQAKENSLDLETEIKQLILHGILHLCGFDHETDDGEMNRLELKYRRKLKINF